MGGGRTAVRTDLNNFHLQLEVKFKPTKISLKWKDPLKMFRNPWPGYKYISNENLSTIRKSEKNLGTQSLKYGPYNITWLIRYNFGKSYTKMKTSHNFDFRIFLRSDFELHVLVHVSVCVIEPISIRAFNPLSADIKEAVCASPKLQVSKEHWMFDCSNCTKNWSIFLRFNSLFHSLAKYSLYELDPWLLNPSFRVQSSKTWFAVQSHSHHMPIYYFGIHFHHFSIHLTVHGIVLTKN